MTLTKRWFALACLTVALLAIQAAVPGCSALSWMWLGALSLATVVDAVLLQDSDGLTAQRSVEPRLSLGIKNSVTLTVTSSCRRAWRLDLRDEPPASVASAPEDTRLTALSRREHVVTYHVVPRTRGDYTFGDIWLRIYGAFGLISRIRAIPAKEAVRVYPNIRETEKFELLARRGRLMQAGFRNARLIGAGQQFESLREYQTDDDFRRIDWKASARRGKLVSRQYEVERSQNVVIVLDLGRTMLAEIDGIAKVDYAVNAALLLAYVATLADDKVGLLVFADQVQTWIAPQKGRAQVYRLLDALYNARARRVEPDYRSAFAYMSSQWRRRSLMVCFTDLWDPDSSRQTMAELAALQPRHLVACVTLMDSKILRCSEASVTDAASLYQRGVALQVLEDRARATSELQRKGVLVVDTPADRLSASLVNRYLEVKARSLL